MPEWNGEPTTIVVSVGGLSVEEARIALCVLECRPPNVDVIFCAESQEEEGAKQVRGVLETLNDPSVRILYGVGDFATNPKLANIEKGYHASRTDRVIFVDGNLRLRDGFMNEVDAVWGDDVGLVTTAPVADQTRNFWAEVEAAVINLSHARWLLAADALGILAAHGKLLAFRKSWLERMGGFQRLADVSAEDIALTNLARASGMRVRQTTVPFAIPLGHRSLRQVWGRQLRWNQIRCRDLKGLYFTELLNPLFGVCVVSLICAVQAEVSPFLAVGVVVVLWHAAEGLTFAWAMGRWHPRFHFAVLVRDLAAPVLWVCGWRKTTYQWRGKTVETQVQ